MAHNTANQLPSLIPPTVLLFAAGVELLQRQRRMGISPPQGTVARLIRFSDAPMSSKYEAFAQFQREEC